MSGIDKTNICWKIRDTETGLFWTGFSARCSHAIGTRFDRRSALDDTVMRLWHRGGRDSKTGFPLTWEVVEMQLHETLRDTMSGPDAIVDLQIEEHMSKVLEQRFTGISGRELVSGWKLFRRLRRQREFDAWPYIGLRTQKYIRWNDVKSTLKPLGINLTEIKNEENGWALFTTKEAATMARMADMLKGVGEVQELRIAFARAIGIPVERI